MSRSHLSARHFLKQLESDRSKRRKRDIRPDWLTALVESTANLFEPLTGVGRVGYECQLDEEGWSASLYLGAVELVGGKDDGQTRQVEFRFDLQPLLGEFTRITNFSWTVLTDAETGAAERSEFQRQAAPGERPGSFLSIDGVIGVNRVRLFVHSAAPDTVGPGMRRLPDGRFEPV